GFDPALGMSGTRVAYGEETEVQYRMRKDGIEIGYDPEWVIYHLVAPYKLKVEWFFKAGFAWGATGFWFIKTVRMYFTCSWFC
ncbi:MAG: hypothetical protein SGI94_12515, partial [Saprospiraceae bacterium]|nr:hypothetical protein [Saprospiraceae bacterium]